MLWPEAHRNLILEPPTPPPHPLPRQFFGIHSVFSVTLRNITIANNETWLNFLAWFWLLGMVVYGVSNRRHCRIDEQRKEGWAGNYSIRQYKGERHSLGGGWPCVGALTLPLLSCVYVFEGCITNYHNNTDYLSVSMNQKFRHNLALVKVSVETTVFSEARGPFPNASGCWQN